MKQLRGLIVRLAGFFFKARRDRELADEIESHLQMHVDDNLRRGMNPNQARREAVLKLGGVESTKEAYRDRRTLPLIENLVQDTRFAIRQLRKQLGFTCTAILMLAAGMCASVSIFAFADATLLKPLPYRDPTRLVGLFERTALCSECNLSYFDYLDWKKLNTVFSSMDVYQHSGFMLSTSSGVEKALGARVSDGFFRTLKVAPALGRDFYPGEDLPGAARTALISYAAWQNRYGGNADVLGKTAFLDGMATTIIGVLPQEFHFAPTGAADYWTAIDSTRSCEQRRSCHNLFGVGRLKDGVTVEAAHANMTLIAQQLEKQYPGSNRGQGAVVLPLIRVIVGNVRPILLVLLSGATLLLVIACVNIASLLLVRSEGRKREVAVRTALGASPARLVRQFVAEGLVLVAAGGALGLLSAHWATQSLAGLIPTDMMDNMPYLHGLGLNARVWAFASGIALAAAIVFSITPTLRLSLSDVRDGIVDGSRGSAGTTWRRLGSKLVVVELATAMVLLVGAGLLGKSFYLLLNVDLGIQPDHLATLQVAAPPTSYGKASQRVALGRLVVSRMASLPGVESAAICTLLPVSYNGNTDWIRFWGRPYHGEHNEVNERDVSASYFAAFHARLLRGRFFTDDEDASKPRVVVINAALVRKYFQGEDPIGKKIGNNDLSPESMKEIIGVVDDIKEGALDSEIWPAVYYPFNQSPDNYFSIVIRSAQSERSVLPTLVATMHAIDPGIVTAAPSSMSDRIRESPAAYLHRSSAWLVGAFAAISLLLGVVGLYGVIAYSVSQRTREIGVRMALGAERGAVYRLILREAGWLTGAGIVSGLVCAIACATLIRKLLFSTPPWDAPTLGAVAVVLAISALLASYIPARRAAAINPVDALRAE